MWSVASNRKDLDAGTVALILNVKSILRLQQKELEWVVETCYMLLMGVQMISIKFLVGF